MRLLVTGGAGFIGSNFVLRARATRPDWAVTVIDSMTYAANRESLEPALSNNEVTLVEGSVADAPLVDRLVADCDVVVHFAAESHNDNSLDSPWPFVESNVVGTFTIVLAAIAATAAFFARETSRIHMNDLGKKDAVPVPKEEYERLRTEAKALVSG